MPGLEVLPKSTKLDSRAEMALFQMTDYLNRGSSGLFSQLSRLSIRLWTYLEEEEYGMLLAREAQPYTSPIRCILRLYNEAALVLRRWSHKTIILSSASCEKCGKESMMHRNCQLVMELFFLINYLPLPLGGPRGIQEILWTLEIKRPGGLCDVTSDHLIMIMSASSPSLIPNRHHHLPSPNSTFFIPVSQRIAGNVEPDKGCTQIQVPS
ncbi:hypothetical protein DFP72DRAFT_1114384 [Ephemerocybe angulata]|uniref:Uncharacterized protein n=1 Tax=Ephemerocybe angulata TaxID=980116 RepID=A0A8H6M6Q4_9AGAR|nr:hypothetical protein DFP72DRAFT_1114384 [Tulosesus angulatus]